jgi:hypothetical protein
MANDMLIDDITLMKVKVDRESVDGMLQVAMDNTLPNEFSFEGVEGIFKINRSKKEFYVLHRNSYSRHPLSHLLPTDADIDLTILKSIKIAKKAGFKIYLEPKFSN